MSEKQIYKTKTLIFVNYISINSLYDFEGNSMNFVKYLAYSDILKDKASFLVNLKASLVFLNERDRIIIDDSILFKLKLNLTNFVDFLFIPLKDYSFIRLKIMETLIEIINETHNLFIPLEIVPFFIQSSTWNKESIPSILPTVRSAPVKDLPFIVEQFLSPFGGYILQPNPKATNDSNIIYVNVNCKSDVNSFLHNYYSKIIMALNRYSHLITSFYWEKVDIKFYRLKIFFDSSEPQLIDTIKNELRLKLFNGKKTSFNSKNNTIYDFLDSIYSKILNKISLYLLYIKHNDNEDLSENICISYAIEFYISLFIKLNRSRSDFFDFNQYIGQKWHSIFLTREELLSDYYISSNNLYKNFDKLYQINEVPIQQNFFKNLVNWSYSELEFEDFFLLVEQELQNLLNHDSGYFRLLHIINCSNKFPPVFSFLEGLMYKLFGLLGLSIENKIYITYIINRLRNEIES